jgi:acyl-CoA thioesterase II
VRQDGLVEQTGTDAARRWLGIRPTDDETTWELTVTPRMCGRTGFLHGGCALGAVAEAMTAVTGRPLLWATCQYLSRAAVEETVRIEVDVATRGNRLTHARATTRVGDRVVNQALGACGTATTEEAVAYGAPPPVPPPQECPTSELTWEAPGSFHRTVDLRLAHARPGDPRTAFWARLGDGVHATAAGLAMLGDYVPLGMRVCEQRFDVMASSLDNTLRVVRLVPTDWVLLDNRFDALVGGAGTGSLRAWSTDGTLLATASQSFAVSRPKA